MGDIITINEHPGNSLLGSNSALFRFQSTSDLYFGNYFIPPDHDMPGPFARRYIRVHVECMELGMLHVTLQSNTQGGQERRAALLANNQPGVRPWVFAGQLIQLHKLRLQDNGMDIKFINAGHVPANGPRDRVEITVSLLGNGELVSGFQLRSFHHGRYKRVNGFEDMHRHGKMVYHPHLHRTGGHRGSTEIDVRLSPGMPAPIGQNADTRRPKRIGSVRLDCQLQMSRKNDDSL